MKTRILVADDEINIADAIMYALKREGFEAYVAYDGDQALKLIEEFDPSIIILDIMMPKQNGYDVCRQIRNKHLGIIMLTAKNTTIDKVLGLELGADDYITKPFEIQELIARVRSLDRRIKKTQTLDNSIEDGIFKFDLLKIDGKERIVSIENINIEFKPKEFDLLYFFVKNRHITFTRDKILDSVWGLEYFGGTRTVDIHIQRIRKKLDKYSSMIKTVPKVGYKFVENIK